MTGSVKRRSLFKPFKMFGYANVWRLGRAFKVRVAKFLLLKQWE